MKTENVSGLTNIVSNNKTPVVQSTLLRCEATTAVSFNCISPQQSDIAILDPTRPIGRFAIKEGHAVIHEDRHGKSNGVADSDAMMSSNRIKVSFISGIRAGECLWVPLDEVSSGRSIANPCFDNADEQSDVAILDPTRPS